MQIEAFPPNLVLHLEHFLHDMAAVGIVEIRKPVQLASELKIALSTSLFQN